MRALAALCAAAALLPGLGCATANPLVWVGLRSADPMRAELERLEEAQQKRDAEAERLEIAARARPPEPAEARLRRGDAHLAGGDLPDALWEYAAAYRLAPNSAAPRVRVGYVHLRSEPERARPLFESALALEPDDVSAHIGLGLVLVGSRETDAGLAHLERAVALAPGSAKAHAALGVSLDRLGRHAEAVRELERARELRPGDARILNNLGVALLRAGAPDRAEEALRAALRLDRRDEALRSNNLGLALALQGRFEDALAAFRRGGDEQGAQSNLGYVHYLRGEYELAIEHFERALVIGGEADLQVVRNLEAVRHAKAAGPPQARRDALPLGGEVVAPAVEALPDAASDTDLALEEDVAPALPDDPS